MKKRIPYGISNFETIATENYYFVDKTKYLEEIDNVKYPVFLRPRRFGKSLFTEMLRCYYDKKYASEFQQIFGQYYIGKNPTKKHNTYFFINFNFSGLRAYAEDDRRIVEKKFNLENNSVIYNFLQYYKEELKLNDEIITTFDKRYENNSAGALSNIINIVATIKGKLFIVIDEYDSLTNAMAIFYQYAPANDNEYLNILGKNGFFRAFFEMIKKGTAKSVDKVYITGILPITIADMNSGFNIAQWITFDKKFVNMLGFTYLETKELVNKIYKDYNLKTDKAEVIITMKQYYDGYKFINNGEYLFNPMMTLYFLYHLINNDDYPNTLIDDNLRIDYNQIAFIFGNNTEGRNEIIEEITAHKKTNFSSKLNVSFNMNNYKNGDYISEGLYYSGILTHGQYYDELNVPNIITYDMALDYFKEINNFRTTGYQISKIIQIYKATGDAESLIENFFEKIIKIFPGNFFKNANESFYHGLLFNVLWNTFAKNIYEVLPEYNLPTGEVDIMLRSLNGTEVRHKLNDFFEIKQVPKKAKEAEFEQQFEKVKKQAQKHITNDYKNWRAIAICFRGNKDYKIKIFE